MLVHLPSQTEDVLYAVTQLHAFVGDPKTIFLSCPSTGALLPMQLLYDRFVIVLLQHQVEL